MNNNKYFSKNDLYKLNILKKLIFNNKFPNKIFISTNNFKKLEYFSFLLIKFLFCLNKKDKNCFCINCKKNKIIDYYDLKICGNFSKLIKKEEIENIFLSFYYSALEKKGIKIFIINGCENLTNEANKVLSFFLNKNNIFNTFCILLSQKLNNFNKKLKSYCFSLLLDNNNFFYNLDEISKNFINSFFNNLLTKKKLYNHILIKKIFNISNEKILNIFLIIIEIVKKNYFKNFFSILNFDLADFIKIFYDSFDLLNNDIFFNKEIILEKIIININNIIFYK